MHTKRIKITVLGTGTSTGVPLPACNCSVCKSTDQKNNRLRCSILLELISKNSTFSLLVDTSTDLRTQSLKYDIKKVDAVFCTHTHADHVCGLDDLRSFNFINRCEIPVYASKESSAKLLNMFSYAFIPDPNYEGGSPPKLKLIEMTHNKFLNFGDDFQLLPLRVLHGKAEVFGFRIGNFAYFTDCSSIPDETLSNLTGLEYLILDGLRERPHNTHFTQKDAAREIDKISPSKSFLTHISHEVEHNYGNKKLKEYSKNNIELAYDGLVLELSY